LINIIGLTAFNGKKDIQNCIEAGMSDVLAKPLKIKELFEILNLF
jgi:CheY-like chemotaxis protein